MTIPFWCLIIVALLPYIPAGLTGYFKVKQLGKMDNHYPRVQMAELRGIGARSHGAQMNAWEALALFATAVFMAHLAGADPRLSAIAAVIFVVARVVHLVVYIADIPPLRTGFFTVGLAMCLWLFGLAIRAQMPM